MSEPAPTALSELLRQWSDGGSALADRVVPLLYWELKRIAARQFRREGPAHTLQTTALVNEAYMRLREVHGVRWESREQFLGFAAHLMRRILVEHARRKASAKRGGGALRITLEEIEENAATQPPHVVALDEALETLGAIDARKAAVVELRFFGGLSIAETAAVLRLSPETVGREWRRAKAWLYRELSGGVEVPRAG